MTKLEQELINTGQVASEQEANEVVRCMMARTKSFESPEDILADYGFDSDEYGQKQLAQFEQDIIQWKQFGAKSEPIPEPTPSDAPLTAKQETMMFKIKALLDKAASSDSQEESDAFMMKAQELIQKNNLSHSRIMGLEAVRGKDGVIVDEAIIEEHVKYDEDWERLLMLNIVKGNMCRGIYNPQDREVFCIGKASNVNAVVMLIGFYRKAILNLAVSAASKRARTQKMLLFQSNPTPAAKSRELARIEKEEKLNVTDYLFGAVDGLDKALDRKMDDFRSSTHLIDASEGGGQISGMEVMRINNDRIGDYVRKKYPYLSRGGSGGGGNSNSASYARGQADGGGLGSSQRRIG